jgi:hypothetical protein
MCNVANRSVKEYNHDISCGINTKIAPLNEQLRNKAAVATEDFRHIKSAEHDMQNYYNGFTHDDTRVNISRSAAEGHKGEYEISIGNQDSRQVLYMDKYGNIANTEQELKENGVSVEKCEKLQEAAFLSRAVIADDHAEHSREQTRTEHETRVHTKLEKSMEELSKVGVTESKFAYQGMDFTVTQPEPGQFHVEAHAPTDFGCHETSSYSCVDFHSDGPSLPTPCEAVQMVNETVESNIKENVDTMMQQYSPQDIPSNDSKEDVQDAIFDSNGEVSDSYGSQDEQDMGNESYIGDGGLDEIGFDDK